MDWLLDDDDQAFGEALSLLAQWDSSEATDTTTSSSGSGSDTTKSSKGSSKRNGKKSATTEAIAVSPAHKQTTTTTTTVNMSRERRKREIADLRKQTMDLTSILQALQRRREELMRPHYKRQQLLPAGEQQQQPQQQGMIISAVPVWESMATRQFQARKNAERTNYRLKSTIARQQRVAQDLLAAIRHAERQQQSEYGMYPITRPLRVEIPMSVSHKMTDAEQFHRVDLLRGQWRAAFASCSQFTTANTVEFREKHVTRKNPQEETHVTICSSSVVPFAVDHVEDALWTLFSYDMTQADDTLLFAHDAKPPQAKDQLCTLFNSTITIDGMRGKVNGKMAIKRYPHHCGDPRTQKLVVSHSYMEPERYGNALDGTAWIEESWLRLVDLAPPRASSSTTNTPLTAIQHVRRNRICFPLKETVDPRIVDKVTKFVVRQMEEETKWARIALDNMLMEPHPQLLELQCSVLN